MIVYYLSLRYSERKSRGTDVKAKGTRGRAGTESWKAGRERRTSGLKKLEKSSWQSKQLMILYQSCFSEERTTTTNFDNWTIDNKYPWKFLERNFKNSEDCASEAAVRKACFSEQKRTSIGEAKKSEKTCFRAFVAVWAKPENSKRDKN